MANTTPTGKKPILGLIGGIGSGKSFVARLLAQRGGYVIEADRLGHEALRQPHIRQRIVEHFGPQVLDAQGEIDRTQLAGLVFAKPDQRQVLEALVHPYITQRIHEAIDRAQADPSTRFIVLDAALLVETGWHRLCDKILFVDAPSQLRQTRTQQSRGWSAEEWRLREANQWPLDQKRTFAHAVLDNSGDEENLRHQLKTLLADWISHEAA
ncbi:MAG: dephospho-CoA kinase [Gemmatales bacterium]|nr:dephospho-CoA kinase [Gemmatales bacterium]MDW8175042.1 dephospho-CoA kinase [Gemmatales bacterium]